MPFSKTFPKTIPGTNYPQWEEVYLTLEEEKDAEEMCKRDNFQIMDDCLREAKALVIKHQINTDDVLSRVAIALFEKRSSHVVYWKENKAKEKFDRKK